MAIVLVIVRFDDAADIDHRITFWNGKRFVAEYPNAMEYSGVRWAQGEFDNIPAPTVDGVELALIGNYGQSDETVIDRKENR